MIWGSIPQNSTSNPWGGSMPFGDDHNPQPAGLMLASKVHHASVLFGVHGQGLDMEEAYPDCPYIPYILPLWN